MQWTTDKPVFTEDCTLVTADLMQSDKPYYDYRIWRIEWLNMGEGYYWHWLTGDGDEWDDIADLKADLYLVLPKHKK